MSPRFTVIPFALQYGFCVRLLGKVYKQLVPPIGVELFICSLRKCSKCSSKIMVSLNMQRLSCSLICKGIIASWQVVPAVWQCSIFGIKLAKRNKKRVMLGFIKILVYRDFLPAPTFSVKASVCYGFCQMGVLYVCTAFQICYGS